MSANETLVIAGASYAGLQLAGSARDAGFNGRIVVVGDEARVPYQRPPLSKGLLTGKTAVDALTLKPPAFFEDNRIELLGGERIHAIDIDGRQVRLASGSSLAYDWLGLCTGARARPLDIPGAELDGVLTLRSLDDALKVDAIARSATRVCVIGAGFIGLEVAAALATRGLSVTVIESCERPLERALAPEAAEAIVTAHLANGVQLLCKRNVKALHALANAPGKVAAVETGDGERIECDFVVAGIGAIPNIELAASAGLKCERGIVTDRCGRTSAPHVLAAGDCAAFPTPFAPEPDRPIILESIQAANDMARAAASVVAGKPMPCDAAPWFWSDQYGLKLQMTGLMAPSDHRVVRGDPDSARFSVFGLRHGRIAWVHSVNRPADHILGRRLVAARVEATPQAIGNAEFELKSLLASTAVEADA